MSQPAAPHEALSALERLYAKKIITLEEGQAAARAITKDDSYAFPQPPKAPEPPAAPVPAPGEPAAPAPAAPEGAGPSPNGDGTSPG